MELIFKEIPQRNIPATYVAINRILAQYVSSNPTAKVGITLAPRKQFIKLRESNGQWDKMIVIYRTFSNLRIQKIEDILNQNFQFRYAYKREVDRETKMPFPQYFVYILTQ